MIPEIAMSAGALLAPLLPSLLKLGGKIGEKALEKIGESIGKDTWERVKELWQALHPALKEPPMEATIACLAADVEKNPQKVKDVADALASHLAVALEKDRDLAAKVAALVKELETNDNNGAAITVRSQVAKNIVNATTIYNLTQS